MCARDTEWPRHLLLTAAGRIAGVAAPAFAALVPIDQLDWLRFRPPTPAAP